MQPTDTIKDPGKFEGEPAYVRELWENVLDGRSDETLYLGDQPFDVFYLDDVDRDRYEESTDTVAIILWETEQGFVNHAAVTSRELKAFRRDCEALSAEEDS